MLAPLPLPLAKQAAQPAAVGVHLWPSAGAAGAVFFGHGVLHVCGDVRILCNDVCIVGADLRVCPFCRDVCHCQNPDLQDFRIFRIKIM